MGILVFLLALLSAPVASRAAPAAGTPKQVLLIRHADETGQRNDAGLSARGDARAAALPTLFPARLPTPQVIFAAKSSKRSRRPVETIAPLAHAVGVPIDERFSDREYAALAKELLSNPAYTGKTIVVCWHHGTMPELAAALGVRSPPARWPKSRYDHVWSITFDANGAHLADLRQQLLPGDEGAPSSIPRTLDGAGKKR